MWPGVFFSTHTDTNCLFLTLQNEAVGRSTRAHSYVGAPLRGCAFGEVVLSPSLVNRVSAVC